MCDLGFGGDASVLARARDAIERIITANRCRTFLPSRHTVAVEVSRSRRTSKLVLLCSGLLAERRQRLGTLMAYQRLSCCTSRTSAFLIGPCNKIDEAC